MKRFKIGMAVAAIKDPFSYQLSQGAMSAAERLDADLCIFPGKYIGVDYERYNDQARYEYQYNALFDIAAAAEFDYIISAVGSIAYPVDNEGKKRHLEIFGKVPTLSVAAKIDGYDHLMFDNRTGIMQAVEHLVKEQGKKCIGMLCGDMNNSHMTRSLLSQAICPIISTRKQAGLLTITPTSTQLSVQMT